MATNQKISSQIKENFTSSLAITNSQEIQLVNANKKCDSAPKPKEIKIKI